MLSGESPLSSVNHTSCTVQLYNKCWTAPLRWMQPYYVDAVFSVLRIQMILCDLYLHQDPASYAVMQALYPPPPPPAFFFSSSDSHRSPPWWAAWFEGECVIWILTSSVYQPDNLDVAAQKFLFSLLSMAVAVAPHPQLLLYICQCNYITESNKLL